MPTLFGVEMPPGMWKFSILHQRFVVRIFPSIAFVGWCVGLPSKIDRRDRHAQRDLRRLFVGPIVPLGTAFSSPGRESRDPDRVNIKSPVRDGMSECRPNGTQVFWIP